MTLSTELKYLNTLVDEQLSNTDNGLQQYLTFNLGDEEYGVDILRVQEIRSWIDVTPVPNTPDYLCGLMNSRSAVIPVIDLRRRLGMEKREHSPTTVIIVVMVKNERTKNKQTMGMVADMVSNTYDIDLKDIKPSPDLGDQVNTSYISGLVAIEDKMMMILDIDFLSRVEALA